MIKLFKWILGYVCFEFSKGFIDGFVNECFVSGVGVYEIKTYDNKVSAKCSLRDYKKLRSLAKKHGGKIKILNKRGLVIPFLEIKNRYGIFLGLLTFVVIINFFSSYIWNIEITGNEKIPEHEITTFLNDNGFYPSVNWNSVDKDSLSALMMATFDECAWVHINRFGSSARVEINEKVDKPEVDNDKGVANIKAKKDGIIVKTTIKSGWQEKFKGDGVTKGDILVSGVYENDDKKINLFTHARGEILAQVNEPFSLTMSRYECFKSYTYKKEYKTLRFFILNIPLYFGHMNKCSCDVNVQSKYLTLNKKQLPIGIVKTECSYYVVDSLRLSDKELVKKAKEKIKQSINYMYSEYEIVSRDIDMELKEDSLFANGTVVCIENIGEEIMIYDKKGDLTKN